MIVVVMGVSGVGKTTVGRLLAAALGWTYYEGDDLHPPRNVEKMRRGEPLTDEDRAPWLEAVADLIRASDRAGENAVVACSALKAVYRARLSAAAEDVRYAFLDAPEEIVAERIERRKGHFMPPSQLPKQFRVLERPEEAVWVDASQAPGDAVRDLRAALAI